jgi:hypothetical protein
MGSGQHLTDSFVPWHTNSLMPCKPPVRHSTTLKAGFGREYWSIRATLRLSERCAPPRVSSRKPPPHRIVFAEGLLILSMSLEIRVGMPCFFANSAICSRVGLRLAILIFPAQNREPNNY